MSYILRGEAKARGDLANLLCSTGNHSEAIEQIQQSLHIQRKIGDRAGEGQNLIVLGNTQILLGQISQGAATQRQCAELNGDIGESHQEAIALCNLGTTLSILLQQKNEAVQVFEKAALKFDLIWSGLLTDLDRVRYADSLAVVATQRLQLLHMQLGHPEEALLWAERARARSLEVMLARQRVANTFSSPSPMGTNLGNGQLPHVQISDLCTIAASQSAAIIVYSLLNRLGTIGLGTIDEKNEELHIMLVWVVSATGCVYSQQVDLPTTGTGGGTVVSELCEALHSDDTALISVLLRRCHALLIEPLTPSIASTSNLFILPDGELHAVPFAALTNSNGAQLITTHAICIASSISTLIELQARSGERKVDCDERIALVVGAPDFTKWSFANGEKLAPLIGAKKESQAVRNALEESEPYADTTNHLVGTKATTKAVRDYICDAHLIHFATHGRPDGVYFSADSQEGAFLRMGEIQWLDLRAALVVLSHCDSFLGELTSQTTGGYTSEGAVGMARAFIAAGALAVVASLWPVEDSATQKLMTEFYSNLLQGGSCAPDGNFTPGDVSRSMRAAMIAMLEKDSANVKHWAGFIVLGLADVKCVLFKLHSDDVCSTSTPIDVSAMTVTDNPSLDEAPVTRTDNDNRKRRRTEDVRCAVTGPEAVTRRQEAFSFKLLVWAMLMDAVETFAHELGMLKLKNEIEHASEYSQLELSGALNTRVTVEHCLVTPAFSKISIGDRKLSKATHTVLVPASFTGPELTCSVRVWSIVASAGSSEDLLNEQFTIRISDDASEHAALVAANAELRQRLTHVESMVNDVRVRQGVRSDLVDSVKSATVRIGILHRQTSSLIGIGSGTIVNAGVDAPSNQVLTAAHVLIDANPQSAHYLLPTWCKMGLPETIDWTSEEAEIILAIGVWEGDDLPSRWTYWAELVTPLEVLQELRESPHAPHGVTQLLDLAVLRIRGRLQVTPSIFKGFDGVPYTVTQKHPATNDLALPTGRPLGNPEALRTYHDTITAFGWFSAVGESALHVPDARVVQSMDRGLLMSQVVLHSAGSGGGTFDHLGRIVGVNSMSKQPHMPPKYDYKSYMRMASYLSVQHGLVLGVGEPCHSI